MWSVCCNFCLADREWWLTTRALEETGKWVMLTLFATFNWCIPVASQSRHSSRVFPWRFLMLDESITAVDQHVCVKPLPAKVSATYHVSGSSALGFFVLLFALEYCKWMSKMRRTQQSRMRSKGFNDSLQCYLMFSSLGYATEDIDE